MTLSFMTIGLQTAINALRRRDADADAALPARGRRDSLLWATIYSALGTALVGAVRALVAG